MKASLPIGEPARLAALHGYDILDTLPEVVYDDITQLAAQICGTPIAFMSLVDEHRQWFKSKVGLAANETSREVAFCAHAILQEDILVVPDARDDRRFFDNPLVTGPLNIRFYAGVPLVNSEGIALGTVCVIDKEPRALSAEQEAGLKRLGRLAMSQMEMRLDRQSQARLMVETKEAQHTVENLLAQNSHLLSAISSILIGVNEAGVVTSWNNTAERVFGISKSGILGRNFDECLFTWDWELLRHAERESLKSGQTIFLPEILYSRSAESEPQWLGLSLSPMADCNGRPEGFLVLGADITKRKQTEDALKRNLSLLKAQQEASPDGILVVDENQRIISFNRRLCEIWQIPEEIIQSGDDDRLLAHALSLIEHKEEFLAKVKYLYEHPYETSQDEFTMLGGTIFDRYAAPIVSEDGKSFGRIWYFRDVTVLKQNARDLQESARCLAKEAAGRDQLSRQIERLSFVTAKTTNAVIITDADGYIEWVNDSFTRISGYTLEEIIGCKPGHLLQGPATDPETIVKLRMALRMGHGFEGEIYNYHKNGQGYWQAISIQPLSADDGITVQGFIAIQTDFWTDRKRSKEETARLAAIVEYSDNAIIGKTLDGTIISWNRGAARLYGYAADEILGKSSSLLLPPDRKDEMSLILQRIQNGSKLDHSETIRMGKDGRIINVSQTLSPVRDSAGRLTGLATIARDITERKKADEALAQAALEADCQNRELAEARDAALDATRLKSEFLANMSHEIRTPMNGVIGMTDLLLGTALDSEQKEYAHIVKQSADALLTVINDILDFSKIEAGQMTLESIEFTLPEVINGIAGLLEHRASNNKQLLTINLPPAADFEAGRMLGDPGCLRQILTNLLGNAIKFTNAEGRVEIGAELISENRTQARWRLFVNDSGIGIPQDRLAAIFESFTQADGSTTRRFGGTGLGLTISRQLTTLMGGQMGVESEVGKGSHFWVEITFEKQETTTNAEIADTDIPMEEIKDSLATMRILMAEDNRINQMVALRFLQRSGISSDNIPVVENGQIVLNALDSGTFDIVLMDVQMPEMDGLETTAAIRSSEKVAAQSPQSHHQTIIAMTAHAMAGDRERCLNAGMDDYITKPLQAVELETLLMRWSPACRSVISDTERKEDRDMAEEALNHNYLRDLCGGDEVFEQELLAEFYRTAPGMAERCHLMLELRDGHGLEHWAHTFKSSCLTVGAIALSKQCQRLEDAGRNGQCTSENLLPIFQSEAARVQLCVGARLSELKSTSGGTEVGKK